MKQEIIDKINKFIDERNWNQFHSGENLAKALVVEASELLELYQWKNEVDNVDRLKEEVADVFLYAIMISEKYGFNIEEIILNKLEQNAKKYPVEKAYGNSKKYNEY